MKDASVMLKELAGRQASHKPAAWPAWFVLSAGGILALAGADNLMDFFGRSQAWNLPDPLLGLPFRYLLPLAGLVELFIAWLCLATSKRTLRLGLVAWLVINFVVYRVGLWTMGWPHPWVLVGGLTDALNISPLVADGFVMAISVYLLVGSVTVLWLGKDDQSLLSGSQTLSVESLKLACPACGGHIQFAIQNLGRKISCPHCQATVTLRQPGENLKMSCFFCQKHIEFPAHALGTRMPCPHCKMDITLNELA